CVHMFQALSVFEANSADFQVLQIAKLLQKTKIKSLAPVSAENQFSELWIVAPETDIPLILAVYDLKPFIDILESQCICKITLLKDQGLQILRFELTNLMHVSGTEFHIDKINFLKIRKKL